MNHICSYIDVWRQTWSVRINRVNSRTLSCVDCVDLLVIVRSQLLLSLAILLNINNRNFWSLPLYSWLKLFFLAGHDQLPIQATLMPLKDEKTLIDFKKIWRNFCGRTRERTLSASLSNYHHVSDARTTRNAVKFYFAFTYLFSHNIQQKKVIYLHTFIRQYLQSDENCGQLSMSRDPPQSFQIRWYESERRSRLTHWTSAMCGFEDWKGGGEGRGGVAMDEVHMAMNIAQLMMDPRWAHSRHLNLHRS